MRNRCRKCYSMNNNFFMQNNCNSSNVIETSCNNVCANKPNYNDNCGCGFDDDYEDVFPENPMLAQSYVPVQTMNKTFTPCTRITLWNHFSRTS